LDVIGEWAQESGAGSRCLRVSERVGRLELEARHAAAWLILIPDGRDAWSAAPENSPSKVTYLLELVNPDKLLFRKFGHDGAPSAEFLRSTARPVAAMPAADVDTRVASRSGGASRSPLVRRPRPLRSRSPAERSFSPRRRGRSLGKGRGRVRDTSPGASGGGGGCCGNGGGASGIGGDDVDRLVNEVKARQRASKQVNVRWREFCEKEGGGIFDPSKHNAGFLQDFVDSIGQAGTGVGSGRSVSLGGGPRLNLRGRSTSAGGGSRSPSYGSKGSHRRGGRLRRREGGERRAGGRKRRREKVGRKGGKDGERGRRRDGGERRKRRRVHRERGNNGAGLDGDASSSGSGSGGSSAASRSSSAGGASSVASSDHAAEKSQEPSSVLTEARQAVDAANVAKADVARALSEERKVSAAEVEARVHSEEDRQRNQVMRRVEEADYQARIEEDEKICDATRRAREEREAKVENVRRLAEEDAREAVLAAESRAKVEAAKRLESLEERLKDADAEAERCLAALESAERESSGRRAAAVAAAGATMASHGRRPRRQTLGAGKSDGPNAGMSAKESDASSSDSEGEEGGNVSRSPSREGGADDRDVGNSGARRLKRRAKADRGNGTMPQPTRSRHNRK